MMVLLVDFRNLFLRVLLVWGSNGQEKKKEVLREPSQIIVSNGANKDQEIDCCGNPRINMFLVAMDT